jgi:HSP20 family protein
MYTPNRWGYGRLWNVADDLGRLQREMNRLFSGTVAARAAAQYPLVNLSADQDGVTLTAEIPGVDPESLDISVKGDALTLQGERPALQPGENEVIHRRERTAGSFTRSFQLPCKVEADKVDANYTHGILTVHLPRTEAEKPRKITIKAS